MIQCLLGIFFILWIFCIHLILAHTAYLLLEDFNWFKKPYKKYLLIPGIAEAVIGIAIIGVTYIIIHMSVKSLFEE